ncbi:unnamed protein product [Dracunculus medinensis]|uniref:RRM domain-containing protein n=1 Tax=Dracunculus medinensis TaxID=318479 RepID=A0A0N4UQ55_DRAME|nr:unnamed protein product [Dracunculus medinensis]
MSELDERTCYVSNLHDSVTQPILEELFTQVGPVETVLLRTKPGLNGKAIHHFAIVVFEDSESVLFATKCLDKIELYGTQISVRPKRGSLQEKIYFKQKQNNFEFAACSINVRDRFSSKKNERWNNKYFYNQRQFDSIERRQTRFPERTIQQSYLEHHLHPSMRNSSKFPPQHPSTSRAYAEKPFHSVEFFHSNSQANISSKPLHPFTFFPSSTKPYHVPEMNVMPLFYPPIEADFLATPADYTKR